MAKDKRSAAPEPPGVTRDHPEQYPTEKPSLFDMWESERHVDPIPMEDLKLDKKEEKRRTHTKDASSGARKYRTGFERD